MEIVRWEKSRLQVVGKRCDQCNRDWRGYRGLDQEFEVYEFTRIQVNAGYGAVHYVDGDRLIADLCQCCTYVLLGRVLRRISNEFEREPTTAEAERSEDALFDFLCPTPPKTTVIH